MSKPLFSTENFLNFVKAKDPSEKFVYADPLYCACAQWAQSYGMTWKEAFDVSPTFVRLDGLIARRAPFTFGQLATLLEKEIQNENV